MGNVKVSIVIPVYNQEKYLDISLPSVINQTYENIEIVIVNDGSTDDSFNIIKKYEQKDNRIIVVNKSNGGLVDATISGSKIATGDYICYLDPDDYIGNDFIKFFLDRLDENYDIVTAGYYTDNNGVIVPKLLKETRRYNKDEVDELRKSYLWDRKVLAVSNEIYVSRWNKIYKASLVKKIIAKFEKCKNVSLGEDSVFTYLALSNVEVGVKAYHEANSYYYNIGNQSSMMKKGTVDEYLAKCNRTYQKFSTIIDEKNSLALELYYFLIIAMRERLKNTNENLCCELLSKLRKDVIYQNAFKQMRNAALTNKVKIQLTLPEFLTPKIYIGALKFFKKIKSNLGTNKRLSKKFIKACKQKGIYKAVKIYRFEKNRENAFQDINKKLPILEKRILPILRPYLSMKTDYNNSPIENNVFVFWWDGFDNAPVIVKKCLESVKKYYLNAKIYEIDKNNYKKYTDIDSTILRDFEKGNISIQTFSDILRFNLLKNNGGVWIDSTIYFTCEFNLINGLKNKSIESVQFSSSNSFLSYKGEKCSWSGYFFAARKQAVFVTAIDAIFREYYLNYKTYDIYFFIDAALMISKIYKLDDNALGKIQKNSHDMFLLSRILNEDDNENYRVQINSIPQKLAWFFVPNGSEKSIYNNLFEFK